MADDRLTQLGQKTRYEPAEVEERIFGEWMEKGYFHPEAHGTSEDNYSISIPPPNITGSLHMGHALNASIQDALIRMRRMQGVNTVWVLGTDHASIATHAVMEKQLKTEGTSRKEIGRDEFEGRVWEWKKEYGAKIVEQFKRIGASCDYDNERFTLDPGYVRAVYRVFKQLFDKGLIYRDSYMVNWDPAEKTAISDLEVEHKEIEDAMYEIKYPLASGDGFVNIATVRPETMFADTAVAVNPEDDRYRHLVGQKVTLPFVGRKLEVISDSHVDPEFGTGALKITPGHDPNDFEIGRKHGLEEVLCIGEDGLLNENAGEHFEGLTVLEGRKAVVSALRDDGLLVSEEKYVHSVGHSHRSGEPIEPLISEQWFCRMDELAAPAIEAVEKGRVRITPERWARVYLDWMSQIKPWCISRQLWWGHRIPVWYCDTCEEMYVAETDPEKCGACDGPVRQEEDVLDTWFSSALWPFATLGWPDKTDELKAFYPTDFLTTARDILYLWVARMLMMGLEFAGDVPFDDVYVHSVILAQDGRRMSKSLGTGIDPLDSIDEFGADALRFGLLGMTSSQDVRFSKEKVRQGQELANKLWNAARLVLTTVDEVAPSASDDTIEDRWIVSKLQKTIERTTVQFEKYDFSHAVQDIYSFFWHDFCDWYLEVAKQRLYEASDRAHVSANLLYVLQESIAMMHPVMPFVTEEVYGLFPEVAKKTEHLTIRHFPICEPKLVDEKSEDRFEQLRRATVAVRRFRDRVGVPAGKPIEGALSIDDAGEGAVYSENVSLVERLAQIDLSADPADQENVASIAVPGGSIQILAGENLDKHEVRQRLKERQDHLVSEINRAQIKLNNVRFTEKAPAAVVEKERDTLQRCKDELVELEALG